MNRLKPNLPPSTEVSLEDSVGVDHVFQPTAPPLSETFPKQEYYVAITKETENGSIEGYVTDPAIEPNFGNWIESEGGVGCRETILGKAMGPIAIMKNLYVEEDARGQGEGNDLVSMFLDDAVERGAKAVVLLADTQDDQNGSGFDLVAFYEGWGFERIADTSGGPIMVLVF